MRGIRVGLSRSETVAAFLWALLVVTVWVAAIVVVSDTYCASAAVKPGADFDGYVPEDTLYTPPPETPAEPEPVPEPEPEEPGVMMFGDFDEAPLEVSPHEVGDSEARQYIIGSESSGDPYATNGPHKGLYQLHEDWWPGFASMTWEEAKTLPLAEFQAVTHRAAEAYMVERYGSWQAALEFHMANGWW
jgi:hypothetical protein